MNEMRSKAVHAWLRELRGRESRGPQMSFCANGKHRLVCLSDRACKATLVVVVYVVEPVEQGISGANVPMYQRHVETAQRPVFSIPNPSQLHCIFVAKDYCHYHLFCML